MTGDTWLQSLIRRAFRLGPAVVEISDAWGRDPSAFTPPEYGTYATLSTAVYRCVDLRAKNLARLPLKLWRVNGAGNRTEITRGRLAERLGIVPTRAAINPHWTPRRLIGMTEWALGLYGSAYWTLERGSSGRQPASEIWWARPDHVRPVPHPTDYLAGYVYEANGERIPFTAGEIVPFLYPNPVDEYAGLSPLASARLAVDTARGAMLSNRLLFDQGYQVAGVLSPAKPETRWTPEQVKQFEEWLAARLRGVSKSHRIAVLSQQASFAPLTLSPKDAEFLGLMKWGKAEVATAYGVAPELIGDHEHATYSNVEQAEKGLWIDTLIPEAEFLADVLTHHLAPAVDEAVDLIEFDFSGVSVLQEDRSEIVTQMKTLWDMGVPLNRLLQEYQPNLLPEKGDGYEWGDVGYLSSTVLPADGSGAPPAGEEADEDEDDGSPGAAAERALSLLKTYRRETERKAEVGYGSPEHELRWKAFTRRADRHEERFSALVLELWRRQQESVLARLRSDKARKDPEEVAAEPFDRPSWGRRFQQEARPVLREIYGEAGGEALEELEVAVRFDLHSPEATRFLERRSQRFAREVNETTWKRLQDSLAAGIREGETVDDLTERVRQVFGDVPRARTIARTEVIGALNGGALEGARQSGVVEGKTWLSALDERTRHTHLEAHGQTVPLEEDFQVGSAAGPSPGDTGDPAEDVNCFPGETLVGADGIERVYRRYYVGQLVEITTASGHQLAGTPNHPVLTRYGWLPLDAVTEGDDLLRYRPEVEAADGHPHVDGVPATLAELFDLAAEVGAREGRLGRLADFHGDGQNGEVEIVTSDRALLNHRIAQRAQVVGERLLPPSDVGSALLSSHGLPLNLGIRTDAPTDGGMGRAGQTAALDGVGSGHAGEHRSAPVADLNPGLAEAQSDGLATDPEGLRQGGLTLTRSVAVHDLITRESDALGEERPSTDAEINTKCVQPVVEIVVIDADEIGNMANGIPLAMQPDRIVNVRRFDFAGDVYNLQTASGWYVANSIPVRNCRCSMVWELTGSKRLLAPILRNGHTPA